MATSGKKKNGRFEITLENALVSNFIRLCAMEGVETENTFKELEVRLDALNELKPPRA